MGSLVTGDVINLIGTYAEVNGRTQLDGTAGSYTILGNIILPSAAIIAMATLDDPVTAEPYEGVRIAIDDIDVSNPSIGAGMWEVTDAATGQFSVGVGNQLYSYPGFATLSVADSFIVISGPLNDVNGLYTIEPRDATDLL